jgi:hypothetical protein
MSNFWETLKSKIVIAAPLADDGSNSDYFFDNAHHRSGLNKGQWRRTKNGAEVLVDPNGIVRAGGSYNWHGKPFSTADRAVPRPQDVPPYDEGTFHPSLMEKYKEQRAMAKTPTEKNRVRSRMLAEANEGASFLPFGQMTDQHRSALDNAATQFQENGPFPEENKIKRRAQWGENHLGALTGLRDQLDAISPGQGSRLLGDRIDAMQGEHSKRMAKMDKLGLSLKPKSAPAPVSTVAPGPEVEPEPPAPVPEAVAPVMKKKRAPKKVAPNESLAPEISSNDVPTQKYPKPNEIIQDNPVVPKPPPPKEKSKPEPYRLKGKKILDRVLEMPKPPVYYELRGKEAGHNKNDDMIRLEANLRKSFRRKLKLD